ncbi:MAG: thiamine diphosphokinase [Holosporaceae bacterium]|jgi:thiamine pyrophosphokinase|nr:thiamine diphosphokinase [Holosporaceae bacterium]
MIKIPEDLSKYRSILCLSGDLKGSLLRDITTERSLPLVAADGAANTLIQNGLSPSVIIGDLDSVDEQALRGRSYLKIESQDSSDFEKALDYVERQSLTPTIIVGINGGYVDRVLENISIFSKTKFLAITKGIVIMMADGRKNLEVPIGTKISIFGIPYCILKSTGLKWELDGAKLFIGGPNSCCNRTIYEEVLLEIWEGRAMIFVYTEIILDAGSI